MPFKVSIEVDQEKPSTLTKKEQQFYLSAVDRKALSLDFTQEEIDIFEMTTTDSIYPL